MKCTPTDVGGVTIIDIERHRDDRGFFSRAFCADEFATYGLISNVAQTTEFGIAWPLPVTVISGHDANWPLLEALGSAAS